MGLVRRWVSALRKPVDSKPANRQASLGMEAMEERLVMDVSVGAVGNFILPTGKDIFVPIPASDADGLPLQFQAASNNENVNVEVLRGGRSLLLNISGTDANDVPFSGSLTIRLFEDLAPETTAHIISLVEQGYYNGLDFHRIIDGFVAQGGDGGSDNNFRIDDEFHEGLTFTSPGLVAMANAGNDTGSTQFFITDIDVPYSNLPQHLNFDHTIFGQVTSGFSLLNSIMTTPTGTVDGKDDHPLKPVVMNSASIITDNHSAVLRISGADDFLDTASITVTAVNPDGASDQHTFNVRGEKDTVNDRPFLGPVPNLETRPGKSVSFTATATDLDGDTLTFSVVNPQDSNSAPDHVRVDIDKSGKITLTPEAGFEGVLTLGLVVSDGELFDTQIFELEVTNGLAKPTSIDLAADSDTGLSNSDKFTSDDTPTVHITARPGSTVEVLVNGVAAGQAKETSAGKYEYTLPAGLLGLGNNNITARTVSGSDRSQETAPLTIHYQPQVTDHFIVPGLPGSGPVNLRFEYTSRQAMFASEFGFFIVDDASGSVNGVAPGEPGYAAAALSSSTRQTIFSQSATQGQVQIVSLQPGQRLGFYLISNGSVETFLQNNPENNPGTGPNAYFGSGAANPDNIHHMAAITDAVFGEALYAWEDALGGGDQDFNDLVVGVRLATSTPPIGQPAQVVTVPDSGMITQLAQFQLLGLPGGRTLNGEFGFFYVDDAEGRIGNLLPANEGYAQAALDPARRQILFKTGDSGISRTVPIAGQSRIAFYFIPRGTSQGLLESNPMNRPNGSQVAYFSFDIANTGGRGHFRWYGSEHVSRPIPGEGEPIRLNVNGAHAGFEDFTVTLSFTS